MYKIVHELEDLIENPEVEFTGDVKIVDEGIGSYEFWGQKCYDHQYVPELQSEIRWNRNEYTDEQNIIIEKYVEDHEDEITLGIEQEYEPDDDRD